MTDDREERAVVTVFLRNRADVLLLRRSEAVGSYAGAWGAVAGHVEPDPAAAGADGGESRGPAAAARAEISEETGFDPDADVTLVRRGDRFTVVDEDLGVRWVVHPFLFDCARRDVEPDEETADYAWVAPTEILRRETVPDLWTSYDRVRPTADTVAADREHGSASLSVRALEVLRDEAALAVERADAVADSQGTGWPALAATARALRDARPAMPVVANRVNRVMAAASEGAAPAGDRRSPRAVERAAVEGIDRALGADEAAAAVAADRLPDGVATLSRSGTVLSAVEGADPESVTVAESRPGREGVGVAERLARETSAAVTLTTDAGLADRVATAEVGAVVVGADAILPDGRVVNKVGTRAAAAAAATADRDVLVVAATDKVATTDAVDREERDPAEVYDGDAPLAVSNPTFDVTPPELVDAVVTDDGVLDADGVQLLADEHRERADWA